MIRIAMWSGPRNISTALMRSFENRPDTFVSDEPFYAYYLKETGIDHPYRENIILKGETCWKTVVKNITQDIPNKQTIWYQKHMAQHIPLNKAIRWIKELNNVLLIRHPKDVILSYIKKFKISDLSQLGYIQQIDIYNMMKENSAISPLILDARDLLFDTEGMLKELCSRLNIPYYKSMLSWPIGGRESDGIWGKHWYKNVEASGFFEDYKENDENFPVELEGILEDCMELYQQLYQHRIRIV